MDNSIDNLLVYTLIPCALAILIGYYIYGWYAHRALRDKYFKEVEKQLKLQTIYLEKLVGPLDEKTRLRIDELEKSTVDTEATKKQTPV
jgi:hypothetical protein